MNGISPDPHMSSRKCPICMRDGAKDPEISSNPPAEDLLLQTLRSYWIEFFKEKKFYYRCNFSGLLFCREYLSPSRLIGFYSQMPENTAGMPIQTFKNPPKGYFQALKKYIPLTAEYWEIGLGIGLILISKSVIGLNIKWGSLFKT